MEFILSIIFLLSSTLANAETVIEKISPQDVYNDTLEAKGPHLFYHNPSVTSNDHLIISLGGTGSQPVAFDPVLKMAADMGYKGIGLDYVNSIVTTACRESKDSDCFNNFREEIVTGNNVCDIVNVTKNNSIEYRIESLLKHLYDKNPTTWSPYFKDGQINWSKIVLIGHSQGSGHVSYLAQRHSVHKVINVGGPQDSGLHGIASWTKAKSATPSENYFAILHEKDFFGVQSQIEVNKSLMKNPKTPLFYFTEDEKVPEKTQILINKKEMKDPHIEIAQPQFPKVWQYLLQP